jgi:hypothetical protein
LNEAEYFNDRVVIEVWIDRSKYGTIDDKTYQVATHFKFDKGDINVIINRRSIMSVRGARLVLISMEGLFCGYNAAILYAC